MRQRRYLIDTHILIWAMEGDLRLAPHYRSIVADGSLLYVSIATLWEIAIKKSLGKLDIKVDVLAALAEYDIEILPLKTNHIDTVEQLPTITVTRSTVC
jgi:PIN domain nuclease of toxin-antitoxin system